MKWNEIEQYIERTIMEQLMANMHDEKFSLYLVRYHNSKVRDSLQDLGLYIQMLIARFEIA